MAIEELLINYGGIGLFTAYLVYDRQILIKKLEDTLTTNTAMLQSLREALIKIHKKL